MGHREYLMYSKSGKYSPEEVVGALSKKVELNSSDISIPTVFIFAKTEVQKDFEHLGNTFKKNTIGAVIEPDFLTTHDVIAKLPLKMRKDIKIDLISFLDDYEEYFKDSELVVNDKKYFSDLSKHDNQEENIEESEEDEER